MRKAKVFPLPVLAAAKTSLRRSKGDDSIWEPTFSPGRWDDRTEAYLPSSRGRIVLCWISVMCSKPNSLTPFSVFSLTSSAREANDVSSNAPERSVKLRQRLICPSDGHVPAVTPVRSHWWFSWQGRPQESLSASADTREKMGNLNGQHLEARWLNFVLIYILNKWIKNMSVSSQKDITICYPLGQKEVQVGHFPPLSLIPHLHSPFPFLCLSRHHLRLPPHQPFSFSSQL